MNQPELIHLRVQYQFHMVSKAKKGEVEEMGLHDICTERKCARYIIKHAPHIRRSTQ